FGAALLGETTGGQLKADPIDFHDGGTLFGGKAGTPCLRVRICLEACAGIWIHINPCEECFESSGTHANCFWVAVRRALPRPRERPAVRRPRNNSHEYHCFRSIPRKDLCGSR